MQPRAQRHCSSRVPLKAELDALLAAHDTRCHLRRTILVRHLRVEVTQHPTPKPAVPHVVARQHLALHQEQHQQPQHFVQPWQQQLFPGHVRRRLCSEWVRLQLQLQRYGPAATDTETHWAGLLKTEKHRVSDAHGRSLTPSDGGRVGRLHHHSTGSANHYTTARGGLTPRHPTGMTVCVRSAGSMGLPSRTRLYNPSPRARG
ncbi:hypothetical protein CaCOL14_006523 [Colletotrichum acutatum]